MIWPGKSTLLNNLFATNFREMDAFRGRQVLIMLNVKLLVFFFQWPVFWREIFFSRSQTTKGIWLAKCAGIEPCTLVMDLEGTDGRERGEVILTPAFSLHQVWFYDNVWRFLSQLVLCSLALRMTSWLETNIYSCIHSVYGPTALLLLTQE